MHNSLIRDAEGNPIGIIGTLRDITEIKQTEEVLRKEIDKAQTYLDIVGVIIVILNTDQTVALINKKGCEILGYEESEILGKKWIENFFPEKDRDKTRATFSELVAGRVEPVEYFENYVLTKDSQEKLIAWHNSILRDDEGKIIATLSSGEDITEHHQVVQALRKSEEKYRSLVESTSDWIWEIDKSGIYTYVSPKVKEILGYEPEELIGKLPLDFMPQDEGKRVARLLKDIIESQESFLQLVNTNIHKDGHYIVLETSGVPIFYSDGNLLGYRGVDRDITKRKQAEKALQESEGKYRSIMESMKDGAYICSQGFRIEYMNPAMIDRIGRDAIGEICHKAIYDMNEKCFWCVFDQVKQKKHVEYEVADPKDNRYYSVINSPIFHEDGTASKLTIFHDITEIKNIEAQLQQSRKMESIGTLTGGIAHDFNNILGVIVAQTELALNDIPKRSPAHSNLETIKTAGLRAADIVKRLLSFGRKTDHGKEPIEIVPVIKNALKFLRSTIPTTIEIRKNIKLTDDTINADSTQINQVMMNLCINASQAMEETSGVLTVKIENAFLDEDSASFYPGLRIGNYVKLTVSDTGPGIDPEIIDRVFDPYFTTKEVGKGSGMGLAVVHGIVKNHDGAITVDSEIGKGTAFTILFPVMTEKPSMEAKTPD